LHNFLQPLFTSFPEHPVYKDSYLLSSLRARDHVSGPYKTGGKITVLRNIIFQFLDRIREYKKMGTRGSFLGGKAAGE
jgi:hypothetical protein